MKALGNKEGDGEAADSAAPRVIAGFGRSGTTWVQDVLAASNGLRPVFEPLHPRNNKDARPFARKFYDASDSDPELRQLLDCYFSGKCRSLWTDYRIVAGRLIPRMSYLTSIDGIRHLVRAHLRAKDNFLRYRAYRNQRQNIVKFIRANMMLSWMKTQFDARIVFIIRHPAAVVLSQMRAADYWDPYASLSRYQQDRRLLDSLDARVQGLLERDLHRTEAYTLCWCIENSVAMSQCRESDIPIVFYEDLVERGQPEWQRILAALSLKSLPDDGLISRPSQQAWGERAASAELLRRFASWMDNADGETVARIQSILDASGVTVYRTSDARPDKSTI